MDYSLSNKEITRLLNNKVKIITHDKIKKYNNINDLLGKNNKCVILYRNSLNYGHWCCLFKNKKGINFFDSYGNKPDEILKFVPNDVNEELKQDHKKLLQLLYKSKYNICFNQYKLQKLEKYINTCGRWVVFRLLNSDLTEDEFKDLFKNRKYSPDELITELVKI